MSSLVNLILLILEVWFLAGLVVTLHRLSKKIGLTILLVFMGGLAAAMQMRSLGWVYIAVGALTFNLDSHTFLPVLLFGLLIIYVINGTLQARGILAGMILLTVIAALFQVLLPLHLSLPGGISLLDTQPGYTPRILIASICSFGLDLVILILVYQTITNIRNHYPSRLAAALALLCALWSDAIIFPSIAFGGEAAVGRDILTHLVGKTIVGVSLLPLLIFYLHKVAPKLPNSAATLPRPALDFFTTSEQLEARAHHHHSLLRTLSEINKLVGRSTDGLTLLRKACELIAESRDYQLVWIAQIDRGEISELVRVGLESYDVTSCLLDETSPCRRAFKTLEKVVINPIKGNKLTRDTWQNQGVESGIRTAAAFPMQHAGQLYGILNIYLARPYDISAAEVEILQDLANDLAYALVSIAAHEQQAILQTAAETMRDGLVIADLAGKLIYTNSVMPRLLGLCEEETHNLELKDFISIGQENTFEDTLQTLMQREFLSFEIHHRTPDGQPLLISINSALVRNEQGQPQHIVANVRDISQQRQYEDQLLALNRLTTELVQIQDIPALLENILHISEELLKADASLIYTVAYNSNQVIDIFGHNISQESTQGLLQGKFDLPGAQALEQLKPVWIGNTGDEIDSEEWLSLLAHEQIRSTLILPISLDAVPTGSLLLGYKQPQFFDENRLQLGMTLAHTLAIIIQNARLYQAERHQYKLAEALTRAAASLNSTLDLEAVFDEILKQILQVVPCQGANIMMIADDHTVYVHRHSGYEEIPGYNEVIQSIRIPTSTPNIKTVLKGDPVLITDTHNDPDWVVFPEVEWIKSCVGIPLKINQEVVGLLSVDSSIPGFFTEETVYRLQTFANHAAIAIRNANLYQQLQDHAAELETRVQKRTSELRAAKEHIEGILASVPDAVFVLDANQELVQVNHAGKWLLDQAKKSNQDLFDSTFLYPSRSTNLPEMHPLLELGDRAYQARASEIVLDENQPTGQVVVFRDVTRFRELDQLKTQFISDVSHELRTPLTNLTLYLGFLENDQVYINQRTYLDILKRETARLTHLIEDLLAFSRIQVSKIGGDIQPVRINQIVDQLVIDRAFLAAQKDIRLTSNPLSDLPLAMADANWLSQSLSNLLTNAINYTPPGGKVSLQTKVKARNQQNWIVIEVIDNGVGIDPDEAPYIFDRFYRGSASNKTGAVGTGLGLAISKELVKRMGGEISFESTLDEGSIFSIYLRPMIHAML